MDSDTFVREHRDEDVRLLALQGHRYPDVDMPYVLAQIAGWQQARRKLPSWAAVEGLRYPPHLNMEQCSSEATARYKADVMRAACQDIDGSEHVLIDFTGGFGVDFAHMAPIFNQAVYVERNAELCDIVRHNLPLLGIQNAECIAQNAEGVLSAMHLTSAECRVQNAEFFSSAECRVQNAELPNGIGRDGASPNFALCTLHSALFYLDPARRDSSGSRTYALADCTPDVRELLPQLLTCGHLVLLKLSPMLDWHQAVAELQQASPLARVDEVHIVSVNGECKELLVLIRKQQPEASNRQEDCLTVHAVDLLESGGKRSDFGFQPSCPTPALPLANPEAGLCLYEPNASMMKAGCFGHLASSFALKALGTNSHLFLSDTLVPGFPGRSFIIDCVAGMSKRELREALRGIDCANIAVRNFPMKAEELRRRLKLRDGGNTYIFGTTAELCGRHVLVVCHKA